MRFRAIRCCNADPSCAYTHDMTNNTNTTNNGRGGTMPATTAPKFRKIKPGMYGTGIHRAAYGRNGQFDVDIIEVVIDRMYDTWYVRELTPYGDMTDALGEAFWTLRDAKDYIVRRYPNV